MSRVFLDVISYEGDSSTLIYKFPEADFNTMSQLVVHESQQGGKLFLVGVDPGIVDLFQKFFQRIIAVEHPEN